MIDNQIVLSGLSQNRAVNDEDFLDKLSELTHKGN